MGIKETKELNKLLAEQAKIYEQQQNSLKNQLQLSRQLMETIRGLNLDNMSNSLENMNTAVRDGADAMEELTQSEQTMKAVGAAVFETSESFEQLEKTSAGFFKKVLKFAPAVAAIEGFGSGLKFSTNAMMGLFGVTNSLIGSFFNLSAAIISAPFKMLGTLMDMAQGYNIELQQAMEDVRKEFGALSSNEGEAVIKSFRNLNHFGGQLAETGLSVYRTMGNMAEALRRVNEMASALGPTFSSFTNEFMGPEAVARLHAYQKGLGLTDEAFRAMGEEALRQGVSMQEMGRRITSVTYAMGEAVGVNGKLISRDVGNMIDDFDHFGNVGVKELAQVSVYARKLGVEVEKLTGVLDQFSDFDKAAESVAQLSQAFGIQLNTLELVQEQDPAANIERLRKSFFAAGRSIETMTRQERALLASHTGLDQKTLSLAFSQEKQSVSYAELQKQGANAEKQQLSQAEAMQKLSSSIERLVKMGPRMDNDFFTIFAKGFFTGIKISRGFYQVMNRLRRAMTMTRYAGMKVGRYFTEKFPGVADVFKGIAEVFQKNRFKKMLNGVVDAFKTFIDMMTTNPKTALPKLLEKLKENFFDWFSGSSAGGKKILGGFKKFFTAFSHIFAGLIKEGIKGITNIFKTITQVMKDPSALVSGVGQARTGVTGFLMDIFSPIIDFFMSPEGHKLLNGLWNSFVDLLGVAWEKIKPKVMQATPYIIGAMFGPAFISAGIRAITVGLAGIFLKGIGGFFKSGAINKSKGILGKGISALMGSATETTKATAGMGAGGGGFSPMSAAASGAKAAAAASKGFGAKDAIALGLKLLAIAGALSLGAIPMAHSVVKVKKILDSGGIASPKDAVTPLLVIGAMAGAMAIAGLAIQPLSKLNPGMMAKAIPGILGLSAVVLALGGTAWAMNKILSGISIGEVQVMSETIQAMGLAYLAAAGVMAAGGALGAIVALTGGIGAVAIIGGIAALALVVEGMAAHALHIMDMINSFKADSGFLNKVNAFAKVIGVVGVLTSSVTDILKMAGPSFFDILAIPFGRNPRAETQKTLGQVTELIDALGFHITNITATIVESLRTLSVEDLEKGKIMASILGSVAELTKALTPPPALVDSISSTLFGQAPDIISSAADFANVMGKQVTKLIPGVEQIMKLANDPKLKDLNMEKIQAVSSAISGIGSLMSALTPSDAAIKQISDDASSNSGFAAVGKDLLRWAGAGVLIEEAPKLVDNMTQYIDIISSAFDKFKPKLTGLIQNMAEISGSIVDVEKFKLVSGVLTTAISIFDVLNNAQDLSNNAGTGIGNLVNNFAAGVTSIDFAILSDAAKAAKAIEAKEIDILEKTVGSLIDTTNSVGKKLRAGSKRSYNIESELQAFADNYGLSKSGKLEIAHQPIQFNVNWTVTLDAEELEKVLLDRPNSQLLSDKTKG